jgi:hypothetical protein
MPADFCDETGHALRICACSGVVLNDYAGAYAASRRGNAQKMRIVGVRSRYAGLGNGEPVARLDLAFLVKSGQSEKTLAVREMSASLGKRRRGKRRLLNCSSMVDSKKEVTAILAVSVETVKVD